MTPELLYQRRWERIAELVEVAASGMLVPVVMPPSEGGGMLIICGQRGFHFFNWLAAVNVDISVADTGAPIEGRRNCFRFDAPLNEITKKVAAELMREE